MTTLAERINAHRIARLDREIAFKRQMAEAHPEGSVHRETYIAEAEAAEIERWSRLNPAPELDPDDQPSIYELRWEGRL